MSDLYLHDDLKQWQDALDALDAARAVLAKTGGWAIPEHIAVFNAQERVRLLRKEHAVTAEEIGPALLTGSRDNRNPHQFDEIYGIYSEDEWHDNRERMRNIK